MVFNGNVGKKWQLVMVATPCCVDYIGGTNIGNVDTHSMQEIWESDAWLAFQTMQLEGRNHENSSCARCDIYRNDHYTKDTIDGFPVEKLRPLNRA